jgi:ABC-type molybdenum transport system ATPase subunit/photorepair protein PhrA
VHLKPREISYGQMRRALLARAMVNSPRLLLLDEPCTGLDAATRATVLEHLEQLARGGVQLVMATHHESDLVPSINRVLRLEQGRVVAP